MTASSPTTDPTSGKLYFLNPERVAFQAVLDLFDTAMRHESLFFLSGASIDTEVGAGLCDTAARAWAECDTAVSTLLMRPDLSRPMRGMAKALYRLIRPHDPTTFDYSGQFKVFSDTSKKLRKRDPSLAHQTMDAALVFHAYEANVKLSKLQRVAVSG